MPLQQAHIFVSLEPIRKIRTTFHTVKAVWKARKLVSPKKVRKGKRRGPHPQPFPCPLGQGKGDLLSYRSVVEEGQGGAFPPDLPGLCEGHGMITRPKNLHL